MPLQRHHRLPFILFLDRDVIDRSLLHFFYIRTKEQYPVMAAVCFGESAKTIRVPPRRSKERAIFSQMEDLEKRAPKDCPHNGFKPNRFFPSSHIILPDRWANAVA